MIAIVLSLIALAAAITSFALIVTARSTQHPDDELLEAFAHLIDEQALRIIHLEKAIRQCWPTFKSYGEKFHD